MTIVRRSSPHCAIGSWIRFLYAALYPLVRVSRKNSASPVSGLDLEWSVRRGEYWSSACRRIPGLAVGVGSRPRGFDLMSVTSVRFRASGCHVAARAVRFVGGFGSALSWVAAFTCSSTGRRGAAGRVDGVMITRLLSGPSLDPSSGASPPRSASCRLSCPSRWLAGQLLSGPPWNRHQPLPGTCPCCRHSGRCGNPGL